MIGVAVFSDLFKAGVSEDGSDFISESFYVVVEYDDGTRLQHRHRFCGFRKECCEETNEPFLCDDRPFAKEQAEALAKSIRDHLNKGKTLNMEHWVYHRPVYGSDAYCAEQYLA